MQEPVDRNFCMLLGTKVQGIHQQFFQGFPCYQIFESFSWQLWDSQELPALFHLYIITIKASNIPFLYLKDGEDLETLAEQGFL